MLVAVSLAACAGGPVAGERGKDTTAARPDKVSSTSDPETYIVERKSANGEEVFFIKQKPDVLPPTAQDRGEVVLDEKGCIRMKAPGQESDSLLVWPSDFEMSTEGGEIRILDGKGWVKARVGDEIRTGGGGISFLEANFDSARELGQHFGVPRECRRGGTYWVVGEWKVTRSRP